VSPTRESVTVVGGGLAGCEAALQLADRGIHVDLHEMRPGKEGPAHHGAELAELVCSNSFKSKDPHTAAGLLKLELEALGSRLLEIAKTASVPAGGALAVDREEFANRVTDVIEAHPDITLTRREVLSVPDGRHVILASGPLTSDALAHNLAVLLGREHLAFYDAAAPIVDAETLDRDVVFAASRYDKGEGADYLNAPMNQTEYDGFIDALLKAERVVAKEFERTDLFSACQPVEEIARAGHDALRFGPLKPVGLIDPRTGERPWAVIQLRAENRESTAYNLVGFQTNLTWTEQKRVFSMIPGFEKVEFLRLGVMHRNTFIDAPSVLDETLALSEDPRIRIAGQLSGTEGYTEAIASGLIAGVNTAAEILGFTPIVLPRESALGSLIGYATDPDTRRYQPMHVNFGLVPSLAKRVRGKRERYAAYSDRARVSIELVVGSHLLLHDRYSGEGE
jgi:methylenetetrahydrofolate--tRNA-(uracil-5-)-methyltransferase